MPQLNPHSMRVPHRASNSFTGANTDTQSNSWRKLVSARLSWATKHCSIISVGRSKNRTSESRATTTLAGSDIWEATSREPKKLVWKKLRKNSNSLPTNRCSTHRWASSGQMNRTCPKNCRNRKTSSGAIEPSEWITGVILPSANRSRLHKLQIPIVTWE